MGDQRDESPRSPAGSVDGDVDWVWMLAFGCWASPSGLREGTDGDDDHGRVLS
ncbi:hypothetical protein ACWCQN_42855 [Streptomyces sp. NPDC001984]